MNKEEFDSKKKEVIYLLNQINECANSMVISAFIIDLDDIDYFNSDLVL